MLCRSESFGFFIADHVKIVDVEHGAGQSTNPQAASRRFPIDAIRRGRGRGALSVAPGARLDVPFHFWPGSGLEYRLLTHSVSHDRASAEARGLARFLRHDG